MSPITLSTPDYLVVAGYFVIVLWIGFYFRNLLSSGGDYFAGGHQIPWWLAGISHYMSSFSAFSFIAYSQLGYTYGWVAVTLFWAPIPGCLLGGFYLAQRWRRARIITPVQFLEERFNPFVRQLFAWAGIPMKVFDDALKVLATGLFVSVSVGLDLTWSIIVCGAVMVAYTFLGGLWALVVTDYVQFLMKGLAILLLLPLAILAAGGLPRAFQNLPEGFFRIQNGPYGWPYILGFFVLMTISYNATWSLAQKYYSVRNEREASKAAYFAAFLNLFGAPLMILPAVIGRNLLPDLLAQNRTADTYVLLVLQLLPSGMIGIIVAAMFSATMAVVSADFNAIASVLTKDVYQRLLAPDAGERRLLRMGRLITLALGILTVALSLWIAYTQQQALFNTMVTVLGLFLAPTLLPLLAGLTVRRLTARGALAGFLGGLTTGLVMLAIKTWAKPASGFAFEGYSILLNTAVTIAGMVLFSQASGQGPHVERFFAQMDRPIEEHEVPTHGVSNAMPVIGMSTLGVGVLLAAAGVISTSTTARVLDILIGLILAAGGARFLRLR